MTYESCRMYFSCDATRARSASMESRMANTTFDTPMTVAMAKQTTSSMNKGFCVGICGSYLQTDYSTTERWNSD